MSKIFLLSVNIGIRIGGELPPAQLGVAYLGTLFGMGGIEPYQWSVSGTLPTGITSGVDSSGDLVFSGTTSEPGLFPIAVTLMDSRGRSITRKFNIRVIADPLVITGSAPDGSIGDAYSYDYAITGGVPPYSISLVIDGIYGPTPEGLTLSQPSTNVIRLSGIPATPQTSTFKIAATDSQTPVSAFASIADTVAIAAHALVVTGAFDDTDEGHPLEGSPLAITGGVTPYGLSGSPYSGTRPPGVTISVSGTDLIATGNTTTAGTYTWTERVTSTDGQHYDVACNVEVFSVPTWDAVVAALSPILWLKMSEASAAAFATAGNYGTGGGAVTTGGTPAPTFGSTPLIPSEPSRTTVSVGVGTGTAIVTGMAASPLLNTGSIYFIYSGTTGHGTAQIAWRNRTGGGGWFINFLGTNIALRIRGSDVSTSIASATVKDGSPHLVGVSVTSTTAALWIDGVKVWTGAVGGSSDTADEWNYMSNSNTFGDQKLYGNFGDFVIFSATMADADHEALYAAYLGVSP